MECTAVQNAYQEQPDRECAAENNDSALLAYEADSLEAILAREG